MPEFFKSKTMMIAYAIVGTCAVAIAIVMVLVIGNMNNQPVIQDTTSNVEAFTATEDNDDDETRHPSRWADEFAGEEFFMYPTSRLTGMPVTDETYNRRPMAVVINNIHRALPQSGITSADIIYEVLSEGDVTRLIAIFQSDIPDEIGPVRSARDYFVDFAFNHDAVFVHHGASPSGYSRIRGSRINSVDGMAFEGRVFWRIRSYPAWARNSGTRPMEHSSYTGWYRLEPHIDDQGIREYFSEEITYGFTFGQIPASAGVSGVAERVVVPFSPNYTRTFVFDAETGLYMVENRDGAHLDALNQEQVSVANVLIQLTAKHIIAGDADGRRNVQTVGSGTGFLATNGIYHPVRWEKTSHDSPMQWFFENGEPLVLSPGTTWICVFQSNGTVRFENFEETAEN